MKMNWARSVSIAIPFLLATTGGMFCGMAAAAPAGSQSVSGVAEKTGKEVSLSTADHSKFTILQQDFKTGPEVTKACLTCHTEAPAGTQNLSLDLGVVRRSSKGAWQKKCPE